jgi:hypothetical protein
VTRPFGAARGGIAQVVEPRCEQAVCMSSILTHPTLDRLHEQALLAPT